MSCKAAAGDENHAKRPVHGAAEDDPCKCGYCHSCHYARKRHRRAQGRASAQRRLFGLSEVDTSALRAAQRRDAQGKPICAICPNRIGVVKNAATDHDHAHCPGKAGCRECVRGYLCSTCNRYLGHIGDDPGTGLRLAAYLIDPPAQKVLTALDNSGHTE